MLLRFIKQYHLKLLFVVILLLAFFLRAQETISGNFLFLLDQGRDLLAVKNIVFDHHLTLIGPYTSLAGVFQGPLWYYLLAIPIFIFQGNPWGTVLLMLIISLLVVVIVYQQMRLYFGTTAGLLTAYLFAISPEAIAAATFSWNPHPMWLILILYAFVLFKTVSGELKFHLLLWPIISLSFHFETAFGVFLLAATLIYFGILNRVLVKNKYFFFGLLISFLFFLPQIVFDLRHDFLMTRSVLKLFTGSNQGLFVGGENQSYFNLIKGHILAFEDNFISSFLRNGYFHNLAKFIFLISIGVIVFARKTKDEMRFLYSLISIILIIIALSFFYPFPVRTWFLTGFQGFYLLIFGLILSKLWLNKWTKYLVLIFILATSMYSIDRLYVLYINPPDDGGNAKVRGKLKAIDYIYNDAAGKPFSLFIFTPPVNTDAFDYLVWWRSRDKYHYLPQKNKEGLFYLLIEPDTSRLWSYQGWLETVIIDGKVIDTKEIVNGLLVQKRYDDSSK